MYVFILERYMDNVSRLEGKKEMRLLNALLVRLLKLPLKVRLSIVAVCFLLCLIPYSFSEYSGPLLAIPVALSIWLFNKRGAFIGIALSFLAIIVVSSRISGSIIWSQSIRIGVFSGSVALLTEAFFISYLRYLLDQAEAAHLQARQAEQQRSIEHEQHIEALQAEQRMAIAYEQQRQLNELKDQIVLNVNHELRSPLTALCGWLDILEVYHKEIDVATQAIYLRRARESSKALTRLVNNILDAGQVSGEVKSFQLEACFVARIVREELEQLDPREVEAYTIQHDIPEQLTVWADQQYLRQILRNLLSNAFKYSPRQTFVVIKAACEDAEHATGKEVAPHVTISVKDVGLGIPSAEQPLLFEKFVRLKRELGGTVRGSGLGLYISKQLVEAMGGRIWVESSGRAGEGSCFCFTLPIATSAPVENVLL